ncbi:Kinesin [Hexamita inflata]|uniref:Kinesin n=2 Tax=Hexamita inflata TaxID=28002 RepID=A0AA86RJC9_9EUKA|nr:Kinesin [Hexamita inflata]
MTQNNNANIVENVHVVVRVRPFLQSEIRESPLQIKQNAIQITTTEQPRTFQFDSVLPQSATQQQVFEAAALDVVTNFTKGMNGCVLCYGQTSSGKTYTCGLNDPISDGIVYRSLYQIFHLLHDTRFELQIQFVQIYNEVLQNLLKPDEKDLVLREVSKNDFQIERLTTRTVTSLQETINVIQAGLKNRAVAPTLANCNSSRAHTILQLNLKTFHRQGHSISKLQILDLAGSERPNKSRSEGLRFQEAVAINSSLSFLGKAVSALSTGKQFVPVRCSVLTKVLSTTLMKNCRTVLIATLCPSVSAAHESVSTLQFAKSCREIVQTVRFNTFGMDSGEEGAGVEKLGRQERIQLQMMCTRAGVQMKDSFELSEVEKIIESLQDQQNEKIQVELEERLQLEKLKHESKVAYYQNLVEAKKESAKASQPPSIMTGEKPDFMSPEAYFIYQKIQELAGQVQNIQKQIQQQQEPELCDQRDLGQILTDYGLNHTQTESLSMNFNLFEEQMESWSGNQFVKPEQTIQLSNLLKAFQRVKLFNQIQNFKSVKEEPKEFVTGPVKNQRVPIKSQKVQGALPSISAFESTQQFKQVVGAQCDTYLREAQGIIDGIKNEASKAAKYQQMEADYYQLIALSSCQMYNFGKVFEKVDGASE